jgi:hypothetical protein
MQIYKINIHSIVDVITNSSTVIYTWQNSEKEAKELLQEVLSLCGETALVDTLFYMRVFLESGKYADKLSEVEEDEFSDYPVDFPREAVWGKQIKYIDSVIAQILCGEIPKPKWMIQTEKKDSYDTFSPSTFLHILPKDPKYTALCKKMLAFLNSPTSDGERDG